MIPKHVSVRMFVVSLALAILPWGCQCGPDPRGDDGGTDAGVDGGDASTGPVCGDGVREGTEACDDGDAAPNDGCSATCTVETGWNCPASGGDCTQVATCGNSVVETGEVCDDGNVAPGDGCTASCQQEAGWACGAPGVPCNAAACGDGLRVDDEECDDGDSEGADGCSASCQLEEGFKCPNPGAACEPTDCGDGIPEGTEACDDGDNDLGDGCTPFCTREPQCTNGTCTAFCGDGLLLPNDTTEQCDDGNTRAGDGCSPTCTLESGFTCQNVTESPPEVIEIPIVYRDFRGNDLTGGHVDFENANGAESGIVGAVGTATLDADGKPTYSKTTSSTTHGATAFNQWYRDTEGVNLTVVSTLALDRQANGSYVFDDQSFYPLDDAGWVAAGTEPLRPDNGDPATDRNFSFTSEARYWFEYKGTEVLTFRGDDDVWVYINRKLALDIGGVHGPTTGTVTLSSQAATLGLQVGRIYEVVVFQAERHTSGSSYRLTLSNFEATRSQCVSLCGNGEIDSGEECDDGNTNNSDSCNNSCRLACQALAESCTPTQGCCSGLVCLDSTGNTCTGSTSCACEPSIGLRPLFDER